ncbi:MAG: hypothetical protein MJZ99_07075 [Bacteroidales bacterium]|nr:hypothetical protein [Bacteroidales bacterium]
MSKDLAGLEFNLQLFAEDGADAGAPAPTDAPTTPEAGADTPPPADDNPFGFPTQPQDNTAGGQDAPQGPPEKYTFNLPEGLTMTDELEQKFTAIAKEAGITQAQADSLIKMHADIVTGIQQQAEKVKNDWAAECHKQGLSTPENLRAAKLAVDTFGGDEAMRALVESGVAFNPAVQKMLQGIGKLLQEDNAPDGQPAGNDKSAADLLFSNSKY